LVETNISMIYMSLLAKYLSGIDTDATVTGTDREEYLRLSYVPSAGCVDIDTHTPCMHDRSRVTFLAENRLCASCDTGQSH
jgi:hypothetical protein